MPPSPIFLFRYQENLHNSVSLIGAIELTASQIMQNRQWELKHPLPVIAILDEMAEMSIQHLKPRDFVYVSGHLGSYAKADRDGKYNYRYEVNFLEINFVAQHGPGSGNQNSVPLESQVSYEDNMQRRRTRLHLWHIFFASPYEWWDNRNCKLYLNSPDFAHKDTGEKLWLKDTDPPWIKQQLQLHDSRLGKQNHGESGKDWLCLSPMVYEDAKRA